MKKIYLYLSFVFAMLGTSSSATTIDLMALYTESVETYTNGEVAVQIEHYIQTANHAFKQSGLDLTVRLVHLQKTNYPEPNNTHRALNDVTYHRAAFANVGHLRDFYGADVVVLFSKHRQEHGNVCGTAWRSSNKSQTYAYVSVGCPDYVLAHELGHNMELDHSERQRQADNIIPRHLEGQGHGIDDEFVTIMAYSSAFGGAKKSYRFSNPKKYCYGFACGVVGVSNAVRVMRKTSEKISQHYPTKVISYQHITDIDESNDYLDVQQQRLAESQKKQARQKKKQALDKSSKRVEAAKKYYQASSSEYIHTLNNIHELRDRYNEMKKKVSICSNNKRKQSRDTRRAARQLSSNSYRDTHSLRISYRRAKKDFHNSQRECTHLVEETQQTQLKLQRVSRGKFSKGRRVELARGAYQKEQRRHEQLRFK